MRSSLARGLLALAGGAAAALLSALLAFGPAAASGWSGVWLQPGVSVASAIADGVPRAVVTWLDADGGAPAFFALVVGSAFLAWTGMFAVGFTLLAALLRRPRRAAA